MLQANIFLQIYLQTSQFSQSESIILRVKKRFCVNFLHFFLLLGVCTQEGMKKKSRNQLKLALILPEYTLNQPGPHCNLQSWCTLFDHTQSHKYRPAARWCASLLSSPSHHRVNQRVLSTNCEAENRMLSQDRVSDFWGTVARKERSETSDWCTFNILAIFQQLLSDMNLVRQILFKQI